MKTYSGSPTFNASGLEGQWENQTGADDVLMLMNVFVIFLYAAFDPSYGDTVS